MSTQEEQFLNLKTFPARVRVEQAALLLGFSTVEIPILAARGLIKPLGHPPVSGVKYFSVVALEELRSDQKWLARASDCIVQYWQQVNRKRRKACEDHTHDAPGRRNGFKRQSSCSGLRSAPPAEAVAE
jgi:hypothetical protein